MSEESKCKGCGAKATYVINTPVGLCPSCLEKEREISKPITIDGKEYFREQSFADAKPGDRVWNDKLQIWFTILRVENEKVFIKDLYSCYGPYDLDGTRPSSGPIIFWEPPLILYRPRPRRKMKKSRCVWINLYIDGPGETWLNENEAKRMSNTRSGYLETRKIEWEWEEEEE
ncbi:hypothetical protein HWQ67_09170 [Candidatus Magnetobacterium casensis]|uniref:Uncharacterized protein n=2 Tax=Candidatus Magnetobacterium casense TaxID=1455061 RepID=A0ABS6RYU9_9BACT|nr:hypothetical protein [Candidatus Magnetobacterium casensis]